MCERKAGEESKAFPALRATEPAYAGGKLDALPEKKEGLPATSKTATQKRKARRKCAIARIATGPEVVIGQPIKLSQEATRLR